MSDYVDTSYAWERRGNAIYTQGDFGPNGYIEGSANLVIDFGHILHIDDIDRVVMNHNDALALLAKELEHGIYG